MTPEERINDLHELGDRLAVILDGTAEAGVQSGFKHAMQQAFIKNPWFDEEMSRKAISAVLPWLSRDALKAWLSAYPVEKVQPKRVGIIMAGNIPAVGFHDLLCVLAAGHHAVVKYATDDAVLIPWMMELLSAVNPAWESRISRTENKLPEVDAVIATGSNNSFRYFEYYFRNKPSLLRKSRSSAAVLSGTESSEWLQQLGEDIFSYYGMGCRSVSKLFVPDSYDFKPFFEAIFPFSSITANRRYLNNYEYFRAYYLMNLEPLLDNHFLLLKRDDGFASPPAVLFYEEYESIQQVKNKLKTFEEQLQCVVADPAVIDKALPPASSQKPGLSDYADGVDTMSFLCSLPA
jgi:hypothetical protein